MSLIIVCVEGGDLSTDHNYLSMYIMEKPKVKLENLMSVGSFFKRCLYIHFFFFFLKVVLKKANVQRSGEGKRGHSILVHFLFNPHVTSS